MNTNGVKLRFLTIFKHCISSLPKAFAKVNDQMHFRREPTQTLNFQRRIDAPLCRTRYFFKILTVFVFFFPKKWKVNIVF